ncbi:16S rRNA (cytosine1402-N4)-methyltransferase [Haloferula luteola]|uniref:Ribosomal RNA small subunit methyltransferase H n=1 Tax=Haloferula luteola TaxID=595692 RepID=A0A840V8M9_9BACT|nr:16S rRNA (cytosine1402-N4)-methyltransferase [Haloferula luteola]
MVRASAFGTRGEAESTSTVVRSGLHGWFAGRRPVIFQAERKESFGTVLLSPISPRVRAGFHGWFAARAADAHFDEVPAARGDDEGYHISVLPEETLRWMEAGPGKYLIDGTLGGGGHSEAFLKTGARVLGVDRDPEAIAYASRRLAPFGDRFRVWQGNFADLCEDPEIRDGERADGLLLDLGVSSHQLDAAERGFSFMREGPLDMRMGPATERTAADIVNEWPESELVRLLREFGEEPKARRIAAALVRQRIEKPFSTTGELADCIEKAVGRSGRTHPATRTFQAIRMEVNDELGSLRRALEASIHLLKPGGRLLVITFHSLEDRMVKQFMRDRSKEWIDQPHWPEPRRNPDRVFRLPQTKAIAPTPEEIRLNPRARSSKLRVAELLDPTELKP